jgi:hypothetical protein
MKTGTLILIGITLSLIALWVIAYNNENGDSNSIGMYFLIYGIVAVGMGIVNGVFLNYAEKQTKKRISLIALGLLPLGMLLVFLLSGIFRITFIGEFGLVGIGITNLIWITERIFTKNKKADT